MTPASAHPEPVSPAATLISAPSSPWGDPQQLLTQVLTLSAGQGTPLTEGEAVQAVAACLQTPALGVGAMAPLSLSPDRPVDRSAWQAEQRTLVQKIQGLKRRQAGWKRWMMRGLLGAAVGCLTTWALGVLLPVHATETTWSQFTWNEKGLLLGLGCAILGFLMTAVTAGPTWWLKRRWRKLEDRLHALRAVFNMDLPSAETLREWKGMPQFAACLHQVRVSGVPLLNQDLETLNDALMDHQHHQRLARQKRWSAAERRRAWESFS
jgi:hypothetical protein